MKNSFTRFLRRIAVVAALGCTAISPLRANELQPQEPAGYTSRIDGSGSDEVFDSFVDPAGNLYTVGRTSSITCNLDVLRDLPANPVGSDGTSADTNKQRFGPDTTQTMAGSAGTYTTRSFLYSLFVVKYDKAGRVVWKRTVAGNPGDNYGSYDYVATGVAADSKGNVYVTGSIAGDATFGSITVKPGDTVRSANGVPVTTFANLFVAMLDLDGNWQWVRPMNVNVYATDVNGRETGYTPTSTVLLALRNGGFTGGIYSSNGNGYTVPPTTPGARNTNGGTADGHSLALGPDGSIYIKGNIEGTSELSPGVNTNTQLYWLNINDNTADFRPTNRVAFGAAYGSNSNGTRRSALYANTAFVARLKATASTTLGGNLTYSWDWMAPATSGIVQDAIGSTSDTNVDKGSSYITGQGTDHYYGNSTSTIGQIAVDDTSVYLTGAWKGKMVLSGSAVATTNNQEGFVARLNSGNAQPIYVSAYKANQTNTSAYAGALVVDDQRNVYMTSALGNNASANIANVQGRTITDSSAAVLTANLTVPVNQQSFIFAKLNAGGAWQWATAPAIGINSGNLYAWVTSLTRDAAGAIYLGGGMYCNPNGSGSYNYFTLGGQDVYGSWLAGTTAFLMKLVDNGGGSFTTPWAVQTYQGARTGSVAPSFDTGAVDAGAGGTIYWWVDAGSGSPIAYNRSPVASDNVYDTTTGRGAFLLPILADGPYLSSAFASFKTAICGQEVTPPTGAYKDPATGKPARPDIYVPGTTTSALDKFYWDDFGKKLYAVSSTIAEVRWRVNADLTSETRLSSTISTVWPTVAQGLVTQVTGAGANADEPKVSLEPASSTRTFNSVLYTESNGTVAGAKVFSANKEGYSVLLYSNGKNSTAASAAVSLTVVRTYLWTSSVVRSVASATVGTTLDPSAYNHSDPEGKNGYVVNRRSRIDAAGNAAAYSFDTQRGPIIPVNTEETSGNPAVDSDATDDLFVIWSRLDSGTGVGWPAAVVRYNAAWPNTEVSEKLVISSQVGNEMELSTRPARSAYRFGSGNPYDAADSSRFEQDPRSPGDTSIALLNNPSTISGTVDQPLFQYGRQAASFSYDLSNNLPPDGTGYLVLYFAEPAPATTGTPVKYGVNVALDGINVLSNLNVAQAAGGVNTALVVKIPLAKLTGNNMKLTFTAAEGATAAFVNAVAFYQSQELLDPAKYTNPVVYNQTDRNLAGYNPNEEHALIAPPNPAAGSSNTNNRLAVFALRSDLNNVGRATSSPYTLVRYQDGTDNLTKKFKVYQVLATDSHYNFSSFKGVAGKRVQPPYPLSLLPGGDGTTGNGSAYFKDRKNQVWAKSNGSLVARYFYASQADFWYDLNGDGVQDAVGSVGVPWLDRYNGTVGTPVATNYTCVWPGGIPVFYVGDTLTSARDGLPDVEQMASATVIYDQATGGAAPTLAASSVRILPYTDQRVVSLPGARVDGTNLSVGGNGFAAVELELSSGNYRFRDLPYYLKTRVKFANLAYDPVAGTTGPALIFGGFKDANYAGRPLVMLNILSATERTRLLGFGGNAGSATSTWGSAVSRLYKLTRDPNQVDTVASNTGLYAGLTKTSSSPLTLAHANALGPKALTAGRAVGSLGYVTLVENNADGLGALPIALHILQVQNPPVVADLKVIASDNPLDEKITVRHSADFGGDGSNLVFDWYYQPANSATAPTSLPPGNGWTPLTNGVGLNDYTFEGASTTTLSDSWVYCRYKGFTAGGYNGDTYGQFAGDPSGTVVAPRPVFVPGWIKRVLNGLNPFEARVKNFASSPTQTYSSALVSAGTRYEGDVALNNDPNNLNSMGLISLYETVLRRGLGLSINGGSGATSPAVNQSLLLAATRVSDLYMLLGNEAYADAQDPTIGFTSADGSIGTLAPSLFAFQNQVPGLIDEELALLRGRDDTSAGVAASPVYNRLYWNFTKGLQGEPTYVQNYGITDQNGDGIINEQDSRVLFPQGHGDAWGHYLSALQSHYRLLRHPLYTWKPNSESTSVAGVAVEVDYLDEQRFAAAAAAEANVGAEIANLTYRNAYTADPAGEWQGYYDTPTPSARSWGVAEWSRRAGQSAYLNWVTANAILPSTHAHLLHNPVVLPSGTGPSNPPTGTGVNNSEPAPTGLQKIDRTTVSDLGKIAAAFSKVQSQMDQSDQGLNPLGLTPGTIPFDIDPNFLAVGSTNQSKTHFEQVYDRAMAAVNNARGVFDYANELTNRLRQTQISANDFAQDAREQEHDFNSRLIEIFGYAYGGDIGSGKTYPTGYNGPDLYHYNYVGVNTISGTSVVPDASFNAFFNPVAQEFTAPSTGATVASDLKSIYSFYFPSDTTPINPVASNAVLTVAFPQATAADWSFAAPATWGARRAPGSLQLAIGDMVRAEAELRRGVLDYQNHLANIKDQVDLLFAQNGLQSSNIKVLDTRRNTIITLNAFIGAAQAVNSAVSQAAELVEEYTGDVVESLPTVVGVANDVTAPLRGSLKFAGTISEGALRAIGAISEISANAIELSKDQVNLSTELQIQKNDYAFEVQQQLKVIESMLREDLGKRIDLFNLQQALTQSFQQYQINLAEGQRIIEELVMYRQKVAGVTQQNRYRDMTFRNFRNDALQKYRASFDLAARYAYLASTTYDYETVQLGNGTASGRKFLTDIVRERALGQFDGNGTPVVGVNGLSDPLARLSQNFQVLKGRLGINNPQFEAGQFSLRSEKFRLLDDESWRDVLQSSRVTDLWQVPEFRRYCRPFAPEASGAQPGLVIPFSTDITFGQNYFGLPLGSGDSSYDSSQFATKIQGVGVSFTNYGSQGLSNTPRVYLVPVGMDVLRAPSDQTLASRQFEVVDQAIPTPFPVGTSSLQNPNWIPTNDSLDTAFNQVRQFSRILAYPDNGEDSSQVASDTRLIGRSVWNTRWLMIIPGGTFLNDGNEGLNTFILGQKAPADATVRDGNGIKDIKVFFQTYSYSGD